MAVVQGPGSELGGDDLLVALQDPVPGHVEDGLELAGKAELAVFLQGGGAHRHPVRGQSGQPIGDLPGQILGEFLGHDPFPDGFARLPEALQVPDVGVGDFLADEGLQAGDLEEALLGIGAHPEAGGHLESQPGEFAQLLGLAPVKHAFPHFLQRQGQRHRRQLDAHGQIFGHQLRHPAPGLRQSGVTAVGHGQEGRHQGLHFLTQALAGLAHIVHIEEEAFAHLDLEVGHEGEDGAVGRQQAFILEITLQQRRGRPQRDLSWGPALAVEPVFQFAQGRGHAVFPLNRDYSF